MKKILTILFVATILSGCVKETTHQQLSERVAASSMNTLCITVKYVGSDETHDYFYLDIPFEKNETYKIPQEETLIKNRFDLTRDTTKWTAYHPPFQIGNFESNEVTIISIDSKKNKYTEQIK